LFVALRGPTDFLPTESLPKANPWRAAIRAKRKNPWGAVVDRKKKKPFDFTSTVSSTMGGRHEGRAHPMRRFIKSR